MGSSQRAPQRSITPVERCILLMWELITVKAARRAKVFKFFWEKKRRFLYVDDHQVSPHISNSPPATLILWIWVLLHLLWIYRLNAKAFQRTCKKKSIWLSSHLSPDGIELQLCRCGSHRGGSTDGCFSWKHLVPIFPCKMILFLLWFSSAVRSVLLWQLTLKRGLVWQLWIFALCYLTTPWSSGTFCRMYGSRWENCFGGSVMEVKLLNKHTALWH